MHFYSIIQNVQKNTECLVDIFGFDQRNIMGTIRLIPVKFFCSQQSSSPDALWSLQSDAVSAFP